MNSVEFSTKAVEDLEGILDFISRDNPNAATRFVAMLKERCKILSQFPEMGEARDELAPSLRVFVVGGHAIYYRPASAGIRVDRVLHGSRDPDLVFGRDLRDQP